MPAPPRFQLELECGNAAFAPEGEHGGPGDEIARILRHVSAQVAEGFTSGMLYDVNGNQVGTYQLTVPD